MKNTVEVDLVTDGRSSLKSGNMRRSGSVREIRTSSVRRKFEDGMISDSSEEGIMCRGFQPQVYNTHKQGK